MHDVRTSLQNCSSYFLKLLKSNFTDRSVVLIPAPRLISVCGNHLSMDDYWYHLVVFCYIRKVLNILSV